jgi:hypothetical protein
MGTKVVVSVEDSVVVVPVEVFVLFWLLNDVFYIVTLYL